MLKSCTIKLHTNNDKYVSIFIDDLQRTIMFDSGVLEIDFTLALYTAKSTYHIVNIDNTIIEYVKSNDYYWQSTKYGEFICRLPCEKEVV